MNDLCSESVAPMIKTCRARRIVLFSVLSVCITAMIFWNSLQNMQVSNELSDGVRTDVTPILSRLVGDSEEVMDQIVRKAAHFVEFAALGLCLGGIASGMRDRFWRSSLLFFPLFSVLSVAVTDEFIQSFSDRASTVKDVILDFCGGGFGLAVMVLTLAVLQRLVKKKEIKT